MSVQNVMSPKVMNAKVIGRLLIGAMAGAAIGWGVMTLAMGLHVSAKAMSWSDFLAVWLGVTFFGVGLAIYATSFNRNELARNLEGEKAMLPATSQEVTATRLQGTTLVLAGVMLLIPIIGMGSLGKRAGIPELLFVAIVLLFGLQTTTNVILWRSSDEFLRSQMMLTGAITFAIGQALLFLWAAGEHLHLVRAISSWDIITILLTIYMATGSYLGIRSRPTC